jgi:hypothetical protein
VTGTASGNLNPANNLSDVASTAAAVSNLLPGVASDGQKGFTVQGNTATSKLIPGSAPYCDIRWYGWVPGSGADIGPYVKQCAANFVPSPGQGQTILVPCVGANFGAGCTWANPLSTFAVMSGNTVTGYGGPGILKIQGAIQSGTTFPIFDYETVLGDGGGAGTQFESGTPGGILGPSVNGALGTAITTTNAYATITPTFTNGSIANLPPGSAITIAATATVTGVPATRIAQNGYGYVTLVLPSALRTPPGETLTVTGCSDSSFDIANGAVSASDFGLGNL